MSKKALEKFATKILPNRTLCTVGDFGAEDLEMGRCLQNSAIFVDERDELLQKRFFPAGVEEHFRAKKDPNYWYDNSQYYEVAQGNLSCCSDTPAGFHYITPQEMYMLEFLTRYVHPFGLERNITEQLPRKLKLKEILLKADIESQSIKFKKHSTFHYLDDTEKYKKK